MNEHEANKAIIIKPSINILIDQTHQPINNCNIVAALPN